MASNSKDHRIANIVRDRYTTLKSDQDPIFQESDEFLQMYRSYMNKSDAYPWDYQLVDPQIFPLMRAHLARLNPQEAKIILESRTGKDQEARRINQQIVNWELEEISLLQTFYRCMFSGFLRGKGYLKSGWKYEPALKVKSDHGEVVMRDILNRADLKNVRFTDLFISDRNNPELSTQSYIIERISMRFGEMWDMNEQTDKEYWKQDLLKKIKEKGMFDNKIEFGTDLPLVEDENEEEISWRNQNVKLLCMHTIDGDVIYTMENGLDDVLNKNQENEYFHGHYPYIDFTPFPEDDEFYSAGIVQPVGDLQIAMSSVLNQLLTNARKAGNPMWIKGQAAAQTPDWSFVNRPDGVISVTGDINQIQQVQIKDTSAPLLTLRSELQNSFERGTSLSSLYTSGVSSTPTINKTATGAKIIDQNTDINLQLLVSLFGAQILKRVGEHFLELNAQYITEEQTFRITGKEGRSEYVTASPEDVSANFDVRVSPERMLKQSPALRQASLLNLINTLGELKTQGAPVNLEPVAEALIDSFPETENIDNIFNDPKIKAEEVIDSISKGIEPPESDYDDDHKAITTIINRYLLDSDELSDEQLQAFAEYLSELQKWVQAKNPNMIMPPNQPPQGMLPPGGAPPPMLPMNEAGLGASMDQQLMPPANPGAQLPIPMGQEQLGMLPQ